MSNNETSTQGTRLERPQTMLAWAVLDGLGRPIMTTLANYRMTPDHQEIAIDYTVRNEPRWEAVSGKY